MPFRTEPPQAALAGGEGTFPVNREVGDGAFTAAGVVRRVALEVPDIDMGPHWSGGVGIAFLRHCGRCSTWSTSTSSPCYARAAARA
ncbi:hypothetical protein PV364_17720 [Streptomyces sp. MI02-7b]|nr:hypothetical protein [Streptomyces sp. MI02-7b]